MIIQYYDATNSVTAKKVLDNFEDLKQWFWQVIPPSEDNTEFTHLEQEKSYLESAAVIDDIFDKVSNSSKDSENKVNA